jgi:hypothetical protein
MLLSSLATACASTTVWENADVPREQWDSDRAQCQQQARIQADRDYTLDQQTARTMNYNPSSQWAGKMDRFSAQQRQSQLFASCMTGRGYKQVPASESTDAEVPSTEPTPAASPPK